MKRSGAGIKRSCHRTDIFCLSYLFSSSVMDSNGENPLTKPTVSQNRPDEVDQPKQESTKDRKESGYYSWLGFKWRQKKTKIVAI